MEYHFRDIEKKWQERWDKDKTFKAENNSSKPKYYVLDMFPYPSGAGLHVGHPLGYIASDIMARYKRHKGFNVLHPMGYDSFGLPAEQYAIQTGQHPATTTYQNIQRYREQLDKIGFSFDWDREVRTSNPDYYKWTQWIFIQLFNSWYNKTSDKAEKIENLIAEFEKNGNAKVNAHCEENTKTFSATEWKSFSEKEKSDVLMQYRITYLGEAYVNWCPALGTVLANDEVKDGVSERGGHPVERKLMKQWSMRITAYAQRLLDGLEKIDWSESIKETQRYWIGRSEGTSLTFSLIPGPSPREKGEEANLDRDSSREKGEEARNDENSEKENKKKYFWQTADPTIYEALKQFARSNRQPQTVAEDKLWQLIRNKNLGIKFRRQHPIGTYIADFICLEKMLIIEVDGEIHEQTKEQDEKRTNILNSLGFQVIRFSNKEILNNIDSVITKIKNTMSSPLLGRGVGGEAEISVFTTRPDTIFGVSFVTLAPEHELVSQITTAEQKNAVDDYIEKAKNRSERERQAEVNKVSGVFTGAFVEHPFTGNKIPVWVGDYVLAGYGTGAVMAVPAHDERDFKFAKHFNLPIPKVIEPPINSPLLGRGVGGEAENSYDEKEGKLINSDFLNGLEVKAAIKKAIEEIENKNLGKGKINFRLRDAVFGRQRYWGEPIPIYYKDGIPHAMPENELPLVLPDVDKYLPTEDGEPPLARAKDWKYKNQFDYEWTTMPGWAGSSWYFLRYMVQDVKHIKPENDKAIADKKALDYWGNVDLYIGGSEHGTGHLLYVRFWTKFLHDLNFISVNEPAKKLINQGMIQGMSELRYVPKETFSEYSVNNQNNHIIMGISTNIDEINKLIEPILPKIEISNSKPLGVTSIFVSADLVKNSNDYYKSHVDINYVETNTLDILKYFKYKENTDIEFYICKEGCWVNGLFYSYGTDEKSTFKTKSEVEKMSKSKKNVVTPVSYTKENGERFDGVVDSFGADTLRLYEMFLGPLEQSKPWNTNGITGVSGFLKKLWKLYTNVNDETPNKAELKTLHKTIKKITEDIDRFSFNTSVSSFMICVNELTELKCNKRSILESLLILVSPYAPHIAEELWNQLGHKESIALEPFPMFNETYLVESAFNYPVSFNGKTRFFQEYDLSLSKEDIEKEIMSLEQTQKYLEGKTPKKIIVVHNKIVNIVV